MKKHKTIKLTELELDYLQILIGNKLHWDTVDGWNDDIKENQALKRISKKLKN
jgi:hypothetical protein